MDKKPLAIIVEDDEFLADIFSVTLQDNAMDTIVFHDGEAAMQIPEYVPTLIVLDLNVPKYSGIEVFNHLRDDPRTKETWVIIATADPVQAATLNKLEAESQNLLILIKPISVSQLEQLAHRLVFSN